MSDVMAENFPHRGRPGSRRALQVGRGGLVVAALIVLPGGANDPASVGMPSATHAFFAERKSRLGAATAPVPSPNLVLEVGAEQARVANAALAFSSEPIEAARPLRFSMDAWSIEEDSSLDCLTAAVYYEAASESVQGQRAVAQVVLNRTRHPSFPNSVCKVVYEGSDRKTGCQFTFTCDGSLNRPPAMWLWNRARLVAREALQGRVEPAVGLATHYHTDWVFPYWAPNLKKITKLGTHIFYSWPGGWGRRSAFNQVPVWARTGAAVEQMLLASPTGEQMTYDHQGTMARPSPLIADTGSKAMAPRGTLAIETPKGLLADERESTLIADEVQRRGR